MTPERPTVRARWQCALAGGAVGIGQVAIVWLFGGTADLFFTGMFVLPAAALSGLVAGYLWDEGVREGAVVGALAGAIAFLPGLLLPLWMLVGVFAVSEGTGMMLAYFILVAFFYVLGLTVAVVLGALGGLAWAIHANGRRQPNAAAGSDDERSASWRATNGRYSGPAPHRDRRGPTSEQIDGSDSGSPPDPTDGSESGPHEGVDRRARPDSDGDDDGRLRRSAIDGSASWWFSAIVGGLVGLVLVPVALVSPLSLIGACLAVAVGGGAAGFLHGGDDRRGAIVGALAGLALLSPPVALHLLDPGELFSGGGDGVRSLVVFFGLPVVVFSALGGMLGANLSNRGRFAPEAARAVDRGSASLEDADRPGRSPSDDDDLDVAEESTDDAGGPGSE